MAALPSLLGGKDVKREVLVSGICGSILLVLGGLSAVFACRALFAHPARQAAEATA